MKGGKVRETVVIRPVRFTDPDGVTYFITAGGTVFLELDTIQNPKTKKKEREQKRKQRKIAHYDFYTKTLRKQEKGFHGLFQKSVAFGFPWHLCKFLHSEPDYGLGTLEVVYQGRLYQVDVETFFREGFFLHFKAKGIELRRFLEITKWRVVG
ncbi:hypothetical protein [Desulfurobacterium crinifex]